MMTIVEIFGIKVHFHFHSWEQIKTNKKYLFMGETCEDSYNSGYKICNECKTVKEYNYDSQGGSWTELSECEAKIILSKIHRDNQEWFFDKQIDTTPKEK